MDVVGFRLFLSKFDNFFSKVYAVVANNLNLKTPHGGVMHRAHRPYDGSRRI